MKRPGGTGVTGSSRNSMMKARLTAATALYVHTAGDGSVDDSGDSRNLKKR